MILPEDDLTLQHEPLKIVIIVWGVRPVADAVSQKSPSSLSLENVSVPGRPLPLFLVMIRRKEDFSWTCLQRLENNHHPLPAPASHFPQQEVRAWLPGPTTVLASR